MKMKFRTLKIIIKKNTRNCRGDEGETVSEPLTGHTNKSDRQLVQSYNRNRAVLQQIDLHFLLFLGDIRIQIFLKILLQQTFLLVFFDNEMLALIQKEMNKQLNKK